MKLIHYDDNWCNRCWNDHCTTLGCRPKDVEELRWECEDSSQVKLHAENGDIFCLGKRTEDSKKSVPGGKVFNGLINKFP